MASAVISLPSSPRSSPLPVPFPSRFPRSRSRFSFQSPPRVASPGSQKHVLRIRCDGRDEISIQNTMKEEEVTDAGVKVALSMLKFYRREISPLLPSSCRYVPTCSEYSMLAYRRYGVMKGTILTAWRLCRCNPLGGYGFDPPRWFGEEGPSEQ
ncbi:UPF0161 protein At3g09310 isoform X1 [Typha angustifolia]|uniref:UPF0161 protein At3g09310 isoform X1 n=1 Tax=Typha angustifolia TaxID=59011 RepID=UPI003C2D1E6A